MSYRFHSIGHSTRDVETVIEMLRMARVEVLVDVRSFPKSRRFPAFNDNQFPQTLAEYQIGYRHMPALGGRRSKQPQVDDDVNAFWRVRSFHNYADYAMGEAFQSAFDDLVSLGREKVVAMMCSEAVWWRCHRRIITDYLLLRGYPVGHIMSETKITEATPTEGAELRADGMVIYPPEDSDAA
ncbi:DUF488 family protein [Thalassorhabdomicrobium marinisediminis]|uniref:DNA repair protein n=1 Tax=Thalassorhabdomicrobium marinisediminis TaxID=2170577 RepID=A0A2T7FWV7_9RHOB|nr:DUF488 domain-containing protein [Thalassorhabdomicrobium marinisediminis]PVA06647.1 DNA repair protein [Thalassorhabdomicrobium marinisediminis]